MEELNGLIALNINVIVAKAFNLYHQMSSPALYVKWDDIVEETNSTKGCLGDEENKSTIVHGQTCDTLTHCKCDHLLTVYDENATKHWYVYYTVIVKNLTVLRSNHVGSKSESSMIKHPNLMLKGYRKLSNGRTRYQCKYDRV